jgi:sugar lactone lactonase YvrE
MEPNDRDTTPVSVRDRLWKAWLPGVAAAGALAALVAGSLRLRPTPLAAPPNPQPAGTPGPSEQAAASGPGGQAAAPAQPVRSLERTYSQSAVLGGAASPDRFLRSLTGIAVGADDHIYLLGDDEIRVCDPRGSRVRSWQAPAHAGCLAVGPDGRVYVGSSDRIDVYGAGGAHVMGFTAGEKDKPADVTAIAVVGTDILVADASARIIRRYGPDGTLRGLIGDQNKTGGFILPNRSLDVGVDARGVVYATDTGRHQVTAWALDGSPLGKFGTFGMSAPEDFVGCCNPVNLAVTPDGKVVTGEKMVARVKVYDPDGTLLAVIGPEHFDPSTTHIHLAVDSRGRILAADPVRREVKIFSLNQTPQERERP